MATLFPTSTATATSTTTPDSSTPSSANSGSSNPPSAVSPSAVSPSAVSPSAVSPSAVSPSLQAQIDLLREVYAAKLDDKIGEIAAAWGLYLACEDAGAGRELVVTLHRQVHSLAGSGTTFGFPAVSEAARRGEMVLKAVLEDGLVLQDAQKAEIETALIALRGAARRQESAGLFLEPSADGIAALRDAGRPVYGFSDAIGGFPAWISAVETFGYTVEKFDDPAALLSAVRRQTPVAILLDCAGEPLAVERNGTLLSSALEAIAGELESHAPLLWLCQGDDIKTRLQTVRLGGAAFFAHPVDVDSLLVKLDDLTAPAAPEPFRVLIVDDEPSLGRLFSVILRQAGMETHVVGNPFEVMEPLVEFRPDLILMDIYMPGCSGPELACVIRQQEAYIGIPIMFLSVETDVSKQLAAMRQGGDDFLIKPVQPRHLVAAVATRATRARALRNLMVRDSLTGLLNHTKIKEQLEIELDRARRMGHSLSLAMLDIDKFKRINDAYGHATGDRVLRSLSRLLGQQLRQTDVIGRYGGEEFAVIMNGSSPEAARRKLEAVRLAFASLIHCCDGHEFTVSFSAGIASSPPFSDAVAMSEAADRALYQAKAAGRNQIILAEDENSWLRRTPL